MIPNDTPWSGLEPGRTDTRRVDASARWNWFWAVMPRNDVALVLQLSRLPSPQPELPPLKNLELRFQTLPGGPILYIRLKDSAQLELFETLCRDVIAAGEIADSESEALARAVGRTFRWHQLLRRGRIAVLSDDAQKGLIGEIEVLKLLIEALGVRPALVAWKGPSGAPKDFELRSDCIEVKARRAAAQPFVKVTNEHQLADVPGRRIWLAVLAIDIVEEPHGYTLAERVQEVTDVIERVDPSSMSRWQLSLADADYDSEQDYSGSRWIVAPPAFYSVPDEFPRIAAPVPLGISGVSYSLELSACAPFHTEWSDIRSKLTQEDRHE
ncbi:MAG: PD-(D/E)XK motif protein [Xanthomonadales bacterium]|nr:PD-(D/E)XK motif protein [Xanthomonadales bacterium]